MTPRSGDPSELLPLAPRSPPRGTASARDHARRVTTHSGDASWATPQAWFEYLDLESDFTLDPCCQHETAQCAKPYTPAEDGLAQSWAEERVFLKPPYGRELPRWMKKAYASAHDSGTLVVCLVPARVDTEWWHRFAAKGDSSVGPRGPAHRASR